MMGPMAWGWWWWWWGLWHEDVEIFGGREWDSICRCWDHLVGVWQWSIYSLMNDEQSPPHDDEDNHYYSDFLIKYEIISLLTRFAVVCTHYVSRGSDAKRKAALYSKSWSTLEYIGDILRYTGVYISVYRGYVEEYWRSISGIYWSTPEYTSEQSRCRPTAEWLLTLCGHHTISSSSPCLLDLPTWPTYYLPDLINLNSLPDLPTWPTWTWAVLQFFNLSLNWPHIIYARSFIPSHHAIVKG